MTKEQALRILKLLSGLEMYVFMQTDVPDYHQDEIIKVIGDLTDYVLEKENENWKNKRNQWVSRRQSYNFWHAFSS